MQVLRTYPGQTPPYPFARQGERRGSAYRYSFKRQVCERVEGQYLVREVARLFADAHDGRRCA
jgi:hypothetical protein